jgi:hypothetical protein
MHMAVPGLKDFNRLLDSAQSEIEAWSLTPAAAGARPESLTYVLDLLGAIQQSVHVGSLKAGFANIFSTLESFGVPMSEVSPSLVRLNSLLSERENKHPLRD